MESEQKKFLEPVLSLEINTSFFKSMSKLAKFSKDVMTNQKELEKASTIVLNESCSVAIINGLQIKMGDPIQITLPCEFDNSTSMKALADWGANINLMPYAFYKTFSLPSLQNTNMALRMADHLIINPHGIIENLLVKVWKFIFLIDFLVLDMKEDEDLPIILGRPLLSTVRALIDIHDTKLTL
ncbi:uncharacterized protein LOC111919607 [Lactuca sativa]|uniref:uncharacterized protein LOC111919607 n=1 Tax=Lactuca sativa TaxID=4236 RepID=UPI000CD95D44|nr:uncharacterized protein LOC111919607 [Lactuca sativa]